MYRIYSDDDLVFDPRVKDCSVIDPVLSLSVNTPGTLTFTLPDSHPSFGRINRLSGRIKVYRDSTLIFLGRVIEDERTLENRRSYTAEGILSCLIDSIVRPFNFIGTPAAFLSMLLTQHNAQVGTGQQITFGNCTVTSEDDLATSAELYYSTWQLIKDKLLDRYGGYLYLTYTQSGAPILNYLAEAPDTATQSIMFGENLKDIAVNRNADETYTACIPLGAKLKDIDPSYETDARLTIADAHEGVDFLIDTETAALYGTLYAPTELTTWDDITSPTALMQRGTDWLSNTGTRLKETISLSAVDLHNLNAETESFSFLDRVIVSCGDLCPEAEFILTEMKIPLNNPGGMEITLGDSRPSLVGDSVSGLSSAINRIKSIEADYTTNGEAVSIVQQEITNNTTILQSAEQILLTALEDYVRTSDYSAFQESVQTSLSIMSGTIEANFTETSLEITDLDGNVSQEFATIRSFIRMIASGIVIGESSSQIKLKLENDILYFFTGDEDSVSTQNALAYFSAGKLYVNDVQILTSMRIGPFAWVPEANNLNFKLMEST